MQQTLIVTLQGPHHTLDTELPGDVTVGDLLPLLVEMHELVSPSSTEEGVTSWSLYRADQGAPLRTVLTLFDNDVLDGDILFLRPDNMSPSTAEYIQQQVPGELVPDAHTGMIGIMWERDWFS